MDFLRVELFAFATLDKANLNLFSMFTPMLTHPHRYDHRPAILD